MFPLGGALWLFFVTCFVQKPSGDQGHQPETAIILGGQVAPRDFNDRWRQRTSAADNRLQSQRRAARAPHETRWVWGAGSGWTPGDEAASITGKDELEMSFVR